MDTAEKQNAACEHEMASGRTFPWHELYVPDLQKGIEFYTNALGFGHEKMSMGEMGDYNMLSMNGKTIAGMMSTNELPMPGVPPHWAVYLGVDNVDDRVAKVLEHGGTVVVPAMDIETVGRMALIADPQGAHIWLFTPSME